MPLEAKNISFRYSPKEPLILENISLRVERGERIALFAPSGFGKTTLVKLMSGYLEPTEGEILLDGKPLPRNGVCPVQLIYQHPEKAMNPRWRLKKVLEESGELRDDVLDAFGIEKAWLDRFPRELSGGELQRFCVARALMSGADFLICDEISTMLDVITQAQIWNVVLEEAKKRNMGIIAVTHNRHLAERISDRIYDLSQQKYLTYKEGDNTMHIHHDHVGGHCHNHNHDHDHECGPCHDHEHEHEHSHDHACAHGGCGGCGHHEHTPMEELLALMKYMVSHNAAHAKELADLAVQLQKAGSPVAYEQVMAAVSDFEKGNLRLYAVLASLDVK